MEVVEWWMCEKKGIQEYLLEEGYSLRATGHRLLVWMGMGRVLAAG